MTLSRLAALRLAAEAAGAAPFAVSPEEAAALLDRPAEFGPAPGRPASPTTGLGDPVSFAAGLDGTDWHDWFANGAAPDYARYRQAFDALTGLYPELDDALLGHPIHRLDEAAGGMAVVAWMAGVRAGAAYEHLRLALAAPRELCRGCHGHGRTWGGSPYRSRNDGANEERCPDCGGRGWVPTPTPTPAPTLDLPTTAGETASGGAA